MTQLAVKAAVSASSAIVDGGGLLGDLDEDIVGLTVVETSAGTWSGDAPHRVAGANPAEFLGATDPQDGADGITTPANINNYDQWVDVDA
jgi:hypothetical protein